MSNAWWKSKELQSEEIPFEKLQQDLYRAKVRYVRKLTQIKEECKLRDLPDCVYPLWDNLKGRGARGEFALVVAREYYRGKGYTVWVSASGNESKDNFILVSYPGLRKKTPLHPAYARMVKMFTKQKIDDLNGVCSEKKRKGKATRNLGEGDPDLFVFKGERAEERFFVEVKHNDPPTVNQLICLPIIDEMLCEVRLARIVARRLRPR